jgi:site-specific DNA recombinase
MKAALYIRVSTEEQAEEGFSIPAQTKQLSEYCNKNSIEIFKIYADEGISGQKENRPQFQQMIKDAEKKLFNIILVHKFDRFARKVELSQRIKRQLKAAGINVISITEPIEDSPIGFFQEGILELIAEYYVKNLAMESKKGHVERASQGLHNGSVPFGYKIDHSVSALMSINYEQAEVVKMIFDLYLNKGYGCSKISKFLNDSGTPSPVHGRWSHYTVSRMVKNPKYAGYIEYDKVLYEGKHEPLIDKEMYELAQKYMKDRTWKRQYRGHNFERYALLGLLRCGYCKKVMRIHNYTKNHDGYVCNDSTHIDKLERCTHRTTYRTDKLEAKIEQEIQDIIKNYTIVINKENSINDFMINRKNKLELKLARLKEGYLNGVFELDEFLKTEKQIKQDISEITLQPSKPIDINNLWEKYLSTDIPAEKRNVLKQFIESIEITQEKININWHIPIA